MKNFLQTTIGKFVLTIILAILPIIPVWSAPVVPDPIYYLDWISPLQAVSIVWLVGVWYRWEWYSYTVFAAVIALIVFVWWGTKPRTK